MIQIIVLFSSLDKVIDPLLCVDLCETYVVLQASGMAQKKLSQDNLSANPPQSAKK